MSKKDCAIEGALAIGAGICFAVLLAIIVETMVTYNTWKDPLAWIVIAPFAIPTTLGVVMATRETKRLAPGVIGRSISTDRCYFD